MLGHKGVRYQPVPRRVPGVHRAIGIAAAKEHTVLLIGTSFPSLSTSTSTSNVKQSEKPSGVPSLQALATQQIAKHVDLFNALPLLIQSERMSCSTLISHCTRFIRRNLDAVIALAKKKHLDMFLDESITRFLSLPDNENEENGEADGPLHPLLFDIARSGAGELGEIDAEGLGWMASNKEMLQSLPVSTLSKASGSVASRTPRSEKKSILVNDEELAKRLQAECKISTSTAEIASGVKSTPSTIESYSKVQAKQVKMSEESKIHAEDDAGGDNAPSPPSATSQYRCDLCNISCPDENALTMHMGGKRHRNRAKQVEEEEKMAAAATLEAKRRQLLAADQVEARARPQPKKSPWKSAPAEPVPQPRYRLEPPPPPIYESKDHTPQKPANHPPSWSPASSKVLQMNSSGGKKTTTNFQRILEEEQQLKQAKPKPPPAPPKQSAVYAKKPSPPASSPGTKKMCLGAFLEPNRPPPKKREGPAWATSPPPPPAASTVRSYHSTTSSSLAQAPRRKTSFNEIQRKEEELKAKQDGMSAVGIEGQWYVERRERAASITAIAQEEEDMQRLIEEQLAIEEQIRQEQAFIKEQDEKRGQNSSRSRGRGKNTNSRQKSGRGGQGGRGRGRGGGRGRGVGGGQGQGRGRNAGRGET